MGIAGIETLPWDYWGPGRDCSRLQAVPEDAYAQFDALADATVVPLNKFDKKEILDLLEKLEAEEG